MYRNNVFLLLFLKGIITSSAFMDKSTSNNCTEIRNNFAIANANFTYCAIQHSRPITLCENCVDIYSNVVESYANMSKDVINGSSCLNHFINLDRLEILQTLYQNSLDLWNRAKCHECFVFENGQHTRKQSNETVQFLKYYNIFMSCVNDTKDADTLCPDCMNNYILLRDYYSSISKYNEKIGLCMDLVDIMNTTWSFWSTSCCKYREHTEYTFIFLNVLVIIIPAVFYLIAQLYVKKKDPTIIQQSRFAESLTVSGT
ncbi:unnamed protein product [Phaedon cochleariae]|uniref:Osteopetrosis-associated transmembrane protein 1 n=1 Tax=Phaedon cochleariae TaxID=80249 RepID=A0A9P0GQ09_PHACE|nr:unnamed protein product [Phaedon cochleariae]